MSTLTNRRHRFLKTPNWLTTRAKRWIELFGLREWSIGVSMMSKDNLQRQEFIVNTGHQTEAYSEINVPYLNAEVYFGEHLKNDTDGHATVFHELRHLYYDQCFGQWVTDHIIDRYVPPHLKRQVAAEFGEKLEQLIERDIFQFEQLTDL